MHYKDKLCIARMRLISVAVRRAEWMRGMTKHLSAVEFHSITVKIPEL
jgi:hypothetical protein